MNRNILNGMVLAVLSESAKNGGEQATMLKDKPDAATIIEVGGAIPNAPTVVDQVTEKDLPEIEENLAKAYQNAYKEGDPIKRAAYETSISVLAARDFAIGYDVAEPAFLAASAAEQQLSRIPLQIARYAQERFKHMTDPEARLQKVLGHFGNMVTNAAHELLRLSKVPEIIGTTVDGKPKTSLTERLQSFGRGQYWTRLAGEARAALTADLDLRATHSGKNDGDFVLATARDVGKAVALVRAKKRELKAKEAARKDEGNGAGEGQQLGDGKANVQTLKLPPSMPQPVQASMAKLLGEVDAARETDKDGITLAFGQGKDNTLILTVAHILNIACAMVHAARYGDFVPEDCTAVAAYVNKLQEARIEVGTDGEEPIDELEAAQHERHGLPEPQVGDGDEPSAATQED